ncbi:unnamed protein product [Bursaphelenchus okinawaensis]|uniref:Uncharacterized protein n=1 Tax=Bursaphelenchus okinawaensis TaxID=465554 RepID=A0A811L680_9BILA|nr:unnamed protein product [Bursaphelenchus okinawaensis]CAG9117339.1 unnamed protein product [Bursaphelenchus okinawaensis]
MTVLLFILTSIVCIPTGYLAYISYAYSGLEKPGFNYGTLWFIERPLPPLVLADLKSDYLKILVGIVTPCTFAAYLLSIILAWLTLRYLRKHRSVQSVQTLKLQRQLSQCLLMQNILPLFTSAAPVIFFSIPIIFGLQVDNSVTIASMFLSWVPICNPVITILVITPYKAAVLRWLDKLWCGLLKRNKLTIKTMALTNGSSMILT